MKFEEKILRPDMKSMFKYSITIFQKIRCKTEQVQKFNCKSTFELITREYFRQNSSPMKVFCQYTCMNPPRGKPIPR